MSFGIRKEIKGRIGKVKVRTVRKVKSEGRAWMKDQRR